MRYKIARLELGEEHHHQGVADACEGGQQEAEAEIQRWVEKKSSKWKTGWKQRKDKIAKRMLEDVRMEDDQKDGRKIDGNPKARKRRKFEKDVGDLKFELSNYRYA